MSPTEYNADFFVVEKIHIFPTSKFTSLEHNCCFFRTQLSHLWNTIVTSLEHNRPIFGTQPSHLWNTIDQGVWLQHFDHSTKHNTVTVLRTPINLHPCLHDGNFTYIESFYLLMLFFFFSVFFHKVFFFQESSQILKILKTTILQAAISQLNQLKGRNKMEFST